VRSPASSSTGTGSHGAALRGRDAVPPFPGGPAGRDPIRCNDDEGRSPRPASRRLGAPPGATVASQERAALAKVGRDGVHSQKVTYWAREPNIAPR